MHLPFVTSVVLPSLSLVALLVNPLWNGHFGASPITADVLAPL